MTLKKFINDGYLVKKKFLQSKQFDLICNDLNNEIEKTYLRTDIDKLGGSLTGNLNTNPGKYGKLILNLLLKNGLNNILQKISGEKFSDFYMTTGGNLSIPNKHSQHFHMDGNYRDLFYFVSVATSNIYAINGPTEIILGGHKKELPYWKFLFKKKKIKKIILSKGDLIIRRSNLWHRGTINRSDKNRFIIAYLFFKRKDNINIKKLAISNNFKKVTITNNFFGNNFSQRLFEYFYIYFKFLFIAWKAFSSFFPKL
jgi:hypothetical protein